MSGRKKLSGSAALVVTARTGWGQPLRTSTPPGGLGKAGPDIVLAHDAPESARFADVTRASAPAESRNEATP